MSAPDDIVDQELGAGRENEAGGSIDQHQPQPEGQAAASRPEQFARLAPGGASRYLLFWSISLVSRGPGGGGVPTARMF
jgi:hypothetical protein